MPKLFRRLLSLALVLALIGACAAYSIYRATQWVPPFYQEQLTADNLVLQQGGRELEQEWERLQQEPQDDHGWTSIFTENQVNGWLAVTLPEKFPQLLPYSIRAPRVSLSPGDAQIACQYVSPKMSAILSLNIDARATDQPNVVAIYLRDARIGAVPGLLQMAMEEINSAAQRAAVKVVWTEIDGDQVALVTLPEDLLDDAHRFELQDVEIADGELRVAGKRVPIR